MSEQIEPGEGWRLLKLYEVVKERDEYWSASSKIWVQHDGYGGHKACEFHAVRRRIPAKPEAISMMDYRGIIAVTGLPETVTIEQVFYGEESDFVVIETVQNVRQLADWLTRYADWREAQDAAK